MAYENAPDIKDRICEMIAEGKGIKEICGTEGMPSQRTVFDWLSEDAGFSHKYARAREEQADYYADEIIDIADTEKDANRARVRIDARKWKASKLQPKKYGDRLDLNHSGSIQQLTDEQLDTRLAQLLGKAGVGEPSGGSGATEEPA